MSNKEAIATVLEFILNKNINLPQNIINRIFKEMLWSATEDNDDGLSRKYRIMYWSPKAIEHYKNFGTSGLRHEHVYPKNLIKTEIIELKSKKRDDILNILNKFSYAAIITEKEDEILCEKGFRNNIPTNLDVKDMKHLIFSRYIEAGIELKEVQFENEKIINEIFFLENVNGEIQFSTTTKT